MEMALFRDGVIFSYGELSHYGLKCTNLRTITQCGITDETMVTRLVAICMFKDCGNGCANSSVTMTTGNKKSDVIDGTVSLS